MNIGVYYLNNTMGGQWTEISDNIPKVAINEVEIQKSSGTLRIASYGRGVWERPLTTGAFPTVSITAPANNTNFAAGSDITITANASDVDGSVTKVEFFQGSTLLGQDLNAPYSFTWNNVAAGGYTITAKATDNSGAFTTSTAVNINVISSCPGTSYLASGNLSVIYFDSEDLNSNRPAINAVDGDPNTVWFTKWTPTNDPLPHEIQLSLNGTYTVNSFKYLPRQDGSLNGRVGQYEIYVSTDSQNWGTAVATGSFANDATEKVVSFAEKQGAYVRFRALTDLSGNTWTAAAELNVGVCEGGSPNTPPTVSITSPANNASFTEGSNISINATANDADGTVTKVEFFQGTTKLGEDLTAPYSFIWNNVPASSYALTAKATDNGGAVTTSAVVSITVTSTTTTVNPVADAYVQNGNKANTNYGTATTLMVRKDGTSNARETYARFNYSSFTGTTAGLAKLRVYVSAAGSQTSKTISVYGLTDETWGETTITWNNKPTAGTLLGTITMSNATGVWYEFNVTSYVNSQMADKIVSFRLVNEGATTGTTTSVTMSSREASSNKPELVITEPAPVAPGNDLFTKKAETTSNEVLVFPNPASSQTSLSFNSHQKGVANISLFDINGRTIWSKTIAVSIGNNQSSFDVHGLRPGTYMLRLQNGNDIVNKKIIVIR